MKRFKVDDIEYQIEKEISQCLYRIYKNRVFVTVIRAKSYDAAIEKFNTLREKND